MNPQPPAAPSVMDDLEPRRLLSGAVATLANGTLSVAGTKRADRISVFMDRRHHGLVVDVSMNGHTSKFAASAVQHVVVNGGAGNDKIVVSDANGVVGGTHDLIGGDGNDTLVGDAGDDTLEGDAGNDMLDGGAGTDDEMGGAGRDTLIGDANDTLDGSQGDGDTIDNNAGEDGNSGNNGGGENGSGNGNGNGNGGHEDLVIARIKLPTNIFA